MKILYCITSSTWGGAQLHVLELCKNQIARGNEVTFVVGNQGTLLDRVKQLKGVKVILLPSLWRKISPWNDLKTVYLLRKLIKQEQPDLVSLHSSKAGILGRLANFRLAPPTIFTVHGWAFTEGVPHRKWLYRMIERLVAPMTDLFICVSEHDQQIGLKAHVINQGNSVVIHNGSPKPVDFDIDNRKIHNPLRLVMTARFSLQKDQKTLVEAIKGLNPAKYHLTFVGDGETLPSIKELVAQEGLADNISFVGFQMDIASYLKDNDVYILSTHYEGLPISVIEALSYGLPIIATDVGGNSELVDSSNGYLVNNSNDLRAAIADLLEHPAKIRRLGKASLQKYQAGFVLKDKLAQTNAAYVSLLKK